MASGSTDDNRCQYVHQRLKLQVEEYSKDPTLDASQVGSLTAPSHAPSSGEDGAEVNIDRQRIVGLGHPGCVAEQLPHGDRTWKLEDSCEFWKDIGDGVVESDEVAVGKPEHGHGCHGFGNAGGLHPVIGCACVLVSRSRTP
ncbi:hypothetical protein NicSoilC5_03960 [Arthrobacter sp. NicSoilC5]|nr:hypothetical protein NicSoilC5_03960 [Arthrobacter sp. NicSoilC5]